MKRFLQSAWRSSRGVVNVCSVGLSRRKLATVNQQDLWVRRAHNWRQETSALADDAYYAGVDRRLTTTLARLPNVEQVLEVGCFSGYRLAKVQDALGSTLTIGLDVVFQGLQAAQEAGISSQRLVNGDARRLPFRSGSFDCVYTCVSLTHVPERQIGVVLDELVRVTRRYVVLVEIYDRLMRLSRRLRVWAWTDGYCHEYPTLLAQRGLTPLHLEGLEDGVGHPRCTLFVYERRQTP